MERRDYLISQIQEIGLFLAKLIGVLKKKEEDREEDQLLADARDAIVVEYGWDIDEVLFLGDASFISLMEENLLANENLEKMAFVLELLGDHALEHQTLLRKELYYQKALLLLNYVDRKSQTYSMERRDRIVQINAKL